MVNLRYVEERQTDQGPYEVTQLINSFLGAFAHPWEKYKKGIRRKHLEEAWAEGWPRLDKEEQADKDLKFLGDQLRLIRNGIAHGNIEMLCKNAEGDITHLKIWNLKQPSKPESRDWGTVVAIGQLREFLDCFVVLADQIVGNGNAVPRET